MNAAELIEALGDALGIYIDIDEHEATLQATEVRFASQPSWPFEYSIRQVVTPEADQECQECGGAFDDHDPECPNLVNPHACANCGNNPGQHEPGCPQATGTVVYLGEGSQLGYLPGPAKNALGW
jgi:hypothetical protein